MKSLKLCHWKHPIISIEKLEQTGTFFITIIGKKIFAHCYVLLYFICLSSLNERFIFQLNFLSVFIHIYLKTFSVTF